MTQQPVTLSVTEAREVSADMQRLHTENTTLQQGYAAARLEIESLQARIKTMAEEHADELMVAHLDGMRAAQPAGAQQPDTAYAELPSYEHQRAIMEAERRASLDAFDPDASLTRTEERLYETAFTNGWDRAMRAAQPVGAQQPGDCGNTPYDEGPFTLAQAAPVCGSPADLPPLPDPDLRDVGTTPKDIQDFLRGYATEYAKEALAAHTTQTSPASQGYALDAARYRYLRDVPMDEWPDELAIAFRLQQNAILDAAIDAARKEKQMNTEIDDSMVLDAMRYRWLRHGDNDEKVLKTYTSRPSKPGEPTMFLPRNDELDRLIDAARKQGANHD